MNNCDVVIIGSGVAGLSAAIELSAAGLAVVVLEKEENVGGKMREVRIGGNVFDTGPTVFTMRWVFERIFAVAGTTLESELSIKRADILARHVWDGAPDTVLDLYADIDRTADAIGQFSSLREARNYSAFCADTKAIFDTLKEPYMAAQKPGLIDLPRRVGWSKLGALYRTKPFSTMWSELCEHFQDPRLRQLFARYATYCGSCPYHAAATLMLIAHVEQDGVYLIEGGVKRLAASMRNVAERNGCQFLFNQQVDHIETKNGAVSAVITSDCARYATNHVICNADIAALAKGCFGKNIKRAVPSITPRERSFSAITWAMNAQTEGFPLIHHNVFFSNNYKKEFDQLLYHRAIPDQPTTYICAQDRDDQGWSDASAIERGSERLLILINAPANGDEKTYQEQNLSFHQERTFGLVKRCGLSIKEISPIDTQATTPTDFEQLFPATGGALYGRASHGWQASFKRPGAMTKIPGLYLASGSAHPGPGMPMAALSGRLASECIKQAIPRTYRLPKRFQQVRATQ